MVVRPLLQAKGWPPICPPELTECRAPTEFLRRTHNRKNPRQAGVFSGGPYWI